jgi:hypothetical protein
LSLLPLRSIPNSVTFPLLLPTLPGERTFMKRVTTGELSQPFRNRLTDQLTQNPERAPLGVLAFLASCGKELRAIAGVVVKKRARREPG